MKAKLISIGPDDAHEGNDYILDLIGTIAGWEAGESNAFNKLKGLDHKYKCGYFGDEYFLQAEIEEVKS